MEETQTTTVVETRTGWNGWRVLVIALVILVLLSCSCCTLAQCAQRATEQTTKEEVVEPAEVLPPTVPEGPPSTAVKVPVSIPRELSTKRAKLISEKGQLDQQGRSLELYLFDDERFYSWGLVVESTGMAERIWWQSPNGWQNASAEEDIPERGTDYHNVEFILPDWSLRGQTTVWVEMVP